MKQVLNARLPKSWPATVRSAMLHVVSLAKYAAVYTRSWAADSPNARVRFRSEWDRSLEDAALLREEIRIAEQIARIELASYLFSEFFRNQVVWSIEW